jgi:hypothetical protein
MRKTINTLFILFLILTGSGVFAQDPSSPGEDPGLEAAPINNFIIPMLLVVFVLGYKTLIVKDTKIQNN